MAILSANQYHRTADGSVERRVLMRSSRTLAVPGGAAVADGPALALIDARGDVIRQAVVGDVRDMRLDRGRVLVQTFDALVAWDAASGAEVGRRELGKDDRLAGDYVVDRAGVHRMDAALQDAWFTPMDSPVGGERELLGNGSLLTHGFLVRREGKLDVRMERHLSIVDVDGHIVLSDREADGPVTVGQDGAAYWNDDDRVGRWHPVEGERVVRLQREPDQGWFRCVQLFATREGSVMVLHDAVSKPSLTLYAPDGRKLRHWKLTQTQVEQVSLAPDGKAAYVVGRNLVGPRSGKTDLVRLDLEEGADGAPPIVYDSPRVFRVDFEDSGAPRLTSPDDVRVLDRDGTLLRGPSPLSKTASQIALPWLPADAMPSVPDAECDEMDTSRLWRPLTADDERPFPDGMVVTVLPNGVKTAAGALELGAVTAVLPVLVGAAHCLAVGTLDGDLHWIDADRNATRTLHLDTPVERLWLDAAQNLAALCADGSILTLDPRRHPGEIVQISRPTARGDLTIEDGPDAVIVGGVRVPKRA